MGEITYVNKNRKYTTKPDCVKGNGDGAQIQNGETFFFSNDTDVGYCSLRFAVAKISTYEKLLTPTTYR